MPDQQPTNNPVEPNKPPTQPQDAAPAPVAPSSRRKFILIGLAAIVVLVAAYFVWSAFFAAPKIPDSIVVLSGRIEGDDSAIALRLPRQTDGPAVRGRRHCPDRVPAHAEVPAHLSGQGQLYGLDVPSCT